MREMQRAIANALGCCPESRASPGRKYGDTDARNATDDGSQWREELLSIRFNESR